MSLDVLFWLVASGIAAVSIHFLLAAIARYVIVHGIRKKLLRSASSRTHGVRTIAADIRLIHLRWNGFRPAGPAYFSLVASDPYLSLVSKCPAPPDAAGEDAEIQKEASFNAKDDLSNSSTPPAPKQDRVTELCGLHARFLAAAIRTAERYRLARFVRLLLTMFHGAIVVAIQTFLLPMFAALLDIDISRLSVDWSPPPDPDSDQAAPPTTVHLRIRHIQLGWRARSGSILDSLKAAHSRHGAKPTRKRDTSTGALNGQMRKSDATSVPQGTKLALHLKLAAVISWSDVQLFLLPSTSQAHESKQRKPPTHLPHLDSLWSFQSDSRQELSWERTTQAWLADGCHHPSLAESDSEILSPQATRLLHIPGRTAIRVGTKITTVLDSGVQLELAAAALDEVQSNTASSDGPQAVESDEPTWPDEPAPHTKASESRDTLSINKGMLTLKLCGGQLDVKMAPIALDTNAILELFGHFKRRMTQSVPSSMQSPRTNSPVPMSSAKPRPLPSQPKKKGSAGSTRKAAAGDEKHRDLIHLVDRIHIVTDEIRVLHAFPGPANGVAAPAASEAGTKHETESGSILVAYMRKSKVSWEQTDFAARSRRLSRWARELSRLTRRSKGHGIRHVLSEVKLTEMGLVIHPASSSSTEREPVGKISHVVGRTEARVPPERMLAPIVESQLVVGRVAGQWHLPSEVTNDPLAGGCTALVKSLASLLDKRQPAPPKAHPYDAPAVPAPSGDDRKKIDALLGKFAHLCATKLHVEWNAGLLVEEVEGVIATHQKEIATDITVLFQGIYGNVGLLPTSDALNQSYASVSFNAGVPRTAIDLCQRPSSGATAHTHCYSLVDVLDSSIQGELKATAAGWEQISAASADSPGGTPHTGATATSPAETNAAEASEAIPRDAVRTHIEGQVSGTVRAVRARLDDPLAWLLFQRLATAVGHLAAAARKAKASAPLRPPKSAKKHDAPKSRTSGHTAKSTTYVHTHHVYASLTVLDYDGRCASEDPKRKPVVIAKHAHEGIPCAVGHQIRDSTELPKMNQEAAREQTLAEQAGKDVNGVYVGAEGDVHAAPRGHDKAPHRDPKDMSAAEKAEMVATVPAEVPRLAKPDISDDHSRLTPGERKARDDAVDAHASPQGGSSTTRAYQLPEFCPPLPPAKGGVVGLRSVCPRWRVELVAVQILPGQNLSADDEEHSVRAKLGLEADARDACAARARAVYRSTLLRSTVFDFAVAAVDPVPARRKREGRHGTGPEAADGAHEDLHDHGNGKGYGKANSFAEPEEHEPLPDDGPTNRPPEPTPHAWPEQRPFEIVHVPRSILSVDLSPPDDKEENFRQARETATPWTKEHKARRTEHGANGSEDRAIPSTLIVPDSVMITWHHPEPNVVSIELANTYAILMAISGLRQVVEAAKKAMGPKPTDVSTEQLAGKQNAEDTPSNKAAKDEHGHEPAEPMPRKLKRKVSFEANFVRVDVPMLLPNGLRMYAGIRHMKHQQVVWFPLPKVDHLQETHDPAPPMSEEGEASRHGISVFHLEFSQLLAAVYRKKMGLWQPLRQHEWAEFLSWTKGSIDVDWSSMLFPPPSNSSAPWNGAAIHWDDTGVKYGSGAKTNRDKMPESAPRAEGVTDTAHPAPPAKRLPPILLAGDSVIMSIPFNFVFHDIITGASVGVKATKQLVHETIKGDLAYKVSPSVMKPIPLPPMRLRLRAFVVEFEDNPMDSHLLMEAQVGAVAAKSRLAREMIFHNTALEKLRELRPDISANLPHPKTEEEHQLQNDLKAAANTPPGGHPVRQASVNGSSGRASRQKPHRSFHSAYSFDSSGSGYSAPAAEGDVDEGHQVLQTLLETTQAARQLLDQFESKEWVKLIHVAIEDMFATESKIRRVLENPVPEQVIKERNRTRHDDHKEFGLAEESHHKWLVRMRRKTPKVPLFRSVMTHCDMRVSQPLTFSATDASARAYMDTFGEPVPDGFEFSIFIPMHLEIDMEEWLATLRDYPLPVIHIIPDKSGPFNPRAPVSGTATPGRQPTFQLVTELVVAEQMGYEPSTRHLAACIVHQNCESGCGSQYVLQIPKVTMPTKLFGHPIARVRTTHAVDLAWGHSMSPAMAELGKVLDGFSSPPIDPSPKPGFWDKLPLILHGDFELLVDEPASVNLFLKGSRNPYDIRGTGCGWVMVWHRGVRFTVGKPNAAREVIQILSGGYKLVIPDLSAFACPASVNLVTLGNLRDKGETLDVHIPAMTAEDEVLKNTKPDQTRAIYFPPLPYQKIAWEMRGDVVWGAGFVLERTCNRFSCVHKPPCTSPDPFFRKCRFWDHCSHWKVVTRTPQYIESLPPDVEHDSYAGWRHDHVHFSISVRSRSAPVENPNKVNSLHVTPLTSAHFWAWIHLFNSALSLPIRLGKIWGVLPEKTAGFGKHCATIKYRFDIKPFFASHIYLQHDAKRHERGCNVYLGLKMKVEEFNFDIHQRQQMMYTVNKTLGTTQAALHKPMNAVGLSLSQGEMRVVTAEVTDLGREAMSGHSRGDPAETDATNEALNAFLDAGPDESTDENSGWWDYRDYVELGTHIGRDPNLRSTRARSETILKCPVFNYFRKTRTRKEIEEAIEAEKEKFKNRTDLTSLEKLTAEGARYVKLGAYGESKFGNEGTHLCLLGESENPATVQARIIQHRIEELEAKGPHNRRTANAIRILHDFAEILPAVPPEKPSSFTEDKANGEHHNIGQFKNDDVSEDPMAIPLQPGAKDDQAQRRMRDLAGAWNHFTNRLVLHCPIVLFTDSTRDILHRYYLSKRQRRGQAHFMRAAALQEIRDLKMHAPSSPVSPVPEMDEPLRDPEVPEPTFDSHMGGAENDGVRLLRTLLDRTVQIFSPNPEESSFRYDPHAAAHCDEDVYRGINPALDVRKSTVLVLLRPQIILKSDVDAHSTIVLSAMRIRMTDYAIFDPSLNDSDVAAKILARNWFVFEQVKLWSPRGSESPVLPIETLLDTSDRLVADQHDHTRQITSQTDFVVQYDHFNQLRLSTDMTAIRGLEDFPSDQEHLLHHMDLVRVMMPPFTIAADRQQYGALYNVCTGLLLYQDPAYRQRQERLKTLLLAFDFTDSENLVRVLSLIQLRIGLLTLKYEDCEAKYAELSPEERLEASETFGEIRNLVDELSLFMEAVKTAQDQQSGSDQDKKNGLLVELSMAKMVWYMIKTEEKHSPLAFLHGTNPRLIELHVEKTSFIWLNKADSSAANALSITDISALDPRPDAIFPTILSRYTGEGTADHSMARRGRFLEAAWQVLAPVGGIGIVDRFELDIHPLTLQLELQVGREIMEYAFSTRDNNNNNNNNNNGNHNEGADGDDESIQSESSHDKGSGIFKLPFGKDDTGAHAGGSDVESEDTPTSSPRHRRSTSDKASFQSHKGSLGHKSKAKEDEINRAHAEAILFGDMEDLDHSTMRMAAAMRERSLRNRTFVYVRLPHTIFCLSYRGGNKLIDMYDSVFQTPMFEFGNTTGAMEDLVQHFKRSIIQAAWDQKSTILKGILTHRPHKISKRISARKKLRKRALQEHSKRYGHLSAAEPSEEDEEEEDEEADVQETLVAGDAEPPTDNSRSPRAQRGGLYLTTLEEEPTGQETHSIKHEGASTGSLGPTGARRPSGEPGLISKILSHGTDDGAMPRSNQRGPSLHSDDQAPSGSPSTHKKRHRISRMLKNAFH